MSPAERHRSWAANAILARAARIERKEGRIEDYLFIGGPAITGRAAAERLGVSRRTVQRYRRELRRDGQLT